MLISERKITNKKSEVKSKRRKSKINYGIPNKETIKFDELRDKYT